MSKELTNLEHFQKFSEDPKNCSLQTVQGSHRYIANVIKGTEDGPKNSILIEIFNHFVKDEVKDYVYHRMKKSILLELALCVLQEIEAGGPERAKSLQLNVAKTSAGGKRVIIAEENTEPESSKFPLSPEDAAIFRNIDEATFKIGDSLGISPERTITSGHGKAPPYSKPDVDGCFTPEKSKEGSPWDSHDKVTS